MIKVDLLIHAGSFGLHSFYPKDKSKKDYSTFVLQDLSSEILVNEATFVAERLTNVFVDSSVLISDYKIKAITDCKRSGFGSDFPYCTQNGKQTHGLSNQERKIENYFEDGSEIIERMHKRSLR